MIKTIKKNIEVEEKVSAICDLCGKEYSYKNEWHETQEFIHIHYIGGWASIFGDAEMGDKKGQIDIDICQHCFKSHIVDKIKR